MHETDSYVHRLVETFHQILIGHTVYHYAIVYVTPSICFSFYLKLSLQKLCKSIGVALSSLVCKFKFFFLFCVLISSSTEQDTRCKHLTLRLCLDHCSPTNTALFFLLAHSGSPKSLSGYDSLISG